jgi:hypothetical protein
LVPHDLLGDVFDRGEPAVDEVGAVQQRRVLLAAPAAGPQPGLDVLEVVVVVGVAHGGAGRRGDDLAGVQRRAVVGGHDADVVDLVAGAAADHHRVEAAALDQFHVPGVQAGVVL